ncbi:MAG TPA: amino acid adenylation domain-containing protein [Terracidiphilus sp.]
MLTLGVTDNKAAASSDSTVPCGSGDATQPLGLTHEDRQRVLHEWNGTRLAYPDACVHQLFEEQVARAPDAIAVLSGRQSLSYRELNERANQVARYLRNRNVGPEVLVGVCFSRSPEMVVALLGVWKAGAAYVPLDPSYPRERLSFMVDDAALAVLLTHSQHSSMFQSVQEKTVCLDSDWPSIAQLDSSNIESGVSPSNLAYVMYTSGSTGKPKGAMIIHRGLVNYLWWAVEAYKVQPGGSVPVHSSICFDLTVTSLYPALITGGQVELLSEDMGARNLLAALRRTGDRSLVKITPAHLEALNLQLAPDEVSGMTRTFVIGGENLLAKSVQLWRDFAPATRIINEYGPTETVVGCCVYEVRPEDPDYGSIPIGRPIANTQLYILDEDLKPVAPGTMGELFIGGDGVARGYLNRPELTQQRFLPDPFSSSAHGRMYKTGDLARYREDGVIEYLGRADDQVKIRGYRIELGEIESALATCPAVQSCAVLAQDDASSNKQLVAYVVRRLGVPSDPAQPKEFLKERLPEYMVPARFLELDSLPLTHNGKIDRKALASVVAETTAVQDAAQPRTHTEQSLASIWKDLLKVQEVGINDDFFDLGGHSLLAIKAASRIRDQFGVEFQAQTLFETSTIAALAGILDKTEDSGAQTLQHIECRKQPGPAPLSYSQQPLWFLHRMNPASSAYNIVDVVRLEGSYNPEALKRAAKELLRRHEVLRTWFSENDGRPVQVVSPELELEVPELDWMSLSQPQREQAWSDLVQKQGRKPFDLSKLPLLRMTVAHCTPREHRLLITIHHIIADEWSMEIIQKELRQLYHAFSQRQPSPLETLPIQYADFARWQRDWLQGQALEDQLSYWKQELAAAPFVLDLPTDKPRPAVQSFCGSTEMFTIPQELLRRLKEVGRQEQTTLFMTMEATFAAFLHRYTNQDDILIGTPVANRRQRETEGLVGYFLNSVVLRSRFTNNLNFRTLLRQVREKSLGAYAHADAPFEQLVAELAPQRDASRSPLFQVMFVLHDTPGVSEVSKASSNHRLQNGTSKFDLTLTLSESAGNLDAVIEYSTDLFTADAIRRMCSHYCTLLSELMRDPDESISTLALLTQAERRMLLVDWNDTALEYPKSLCLHELLQQTADRGPERTALVVNDQNVTYGELFQRANQLAFHLRALGVGPDVLVGVMVERSVDMVVALLGILQAGGAYIPLDPAFPISRLAHMVEDSGMKVLLTHRDLCETLSALPPVVVRLDSDWSEIEKSTTIGGLPGVGPECPAYVLYTSGSTGKPKGVAIPHSAIVNFLCSMRRAPGFSEADTLLAVTTLSFDIAGLELYLPLLCGGRVVIADAADTHDPYRLMELIRESKCTVMQATPATFRALLHAGWSGAPNLTLLCGGEPMPSDLAGNLLQRCDAVWNMYGPTETTVWSTIHKVTSADFAVPIGKPIANTQVYVLNANREPVPIGVSGELYIGGDGLAHGYLHREELTGERFVPNPFVPGARFYRTGDLARWNQDGTLQCLNRVDNQVKIRGFRIELGEIEVQLGKHPAVREAAAIVREDVPGDKRIVAYFTTRPGSGFDLAESGAEQLRVHLAASLPEYMLPAAYVRLDALPLTPNGKLDRKALPPPESTAFAVQAYQAPIGEIESKLAEIWAEILRLERVGRNDDFFDLGGHSLLAVQLIARVQQFVPEQPLPLTALLQCPTVARFADFIENSRSKRSPEKAKGWEIVVPMKPGKPGCLPFFCVSAAAATALVMRPLARVLDDGVPLYCIQNKGWDGSGPFTTIQEAAQCYVEEIRKIQPHGPYRLGGYCFGGMVAFEMACILEGMGEPVSSLFLFDIFNPAYLSSQPGRKMLYRLVAHCLRQFVSHAARMRSVPGREWPAYVIGRLSAMRVQIRRFAKRGKSGLGDVSVPTRNSDIGDPADPLGKMVELMHRSGRIAGQAFVPKPYGGDAIIFRTRDREPDPYDNDSLGWKPFVLGCCQRFDLEANHDNFHLDPAVQQIADKINPILR